MKSRLASLFKNRLLFTKRIIGLFLIYVGESIIEKRKPYRFISKVIENIVHSQDLQCQVVNVINQPLFIRFVLHVIAPRHRHIDGKYFIRELAQQLGCEFSDITTGIQGRIYFVDITKTAIDNLEKGVTPYIPQVYNESKQHEQLTQMMKEVVTVSKKVVN